MKLLHFLCFFLLVVSCKTEPLKLTTITAKNIAIDSTVIPSATIDSMISPYKEKLNAEMQKQLSYSPTSLTKADGVMQSALGNLVADLCFEMATPIFKEKTNESIDFAMFNYGGIRATVPAGKITKEHAYKLMPFENELVVVNLSGDKIRALVNYFIENKKAHPLSKNIALTIQHNEYHLTINGKPFDENKTYKVLTSDYLQGGGDKMNFFKNPKKLIKLDYKVRAAMIHYFKKTDTLSASLDNRVLII